MIRHVGVMSRFVHFLGRANNRYLERTAAVAPTHLTWTSAGRKVKVTLGNPGQQQRRQGICMISRQRSLASQLAVIQLTLGNLGGVLPWIDTDETSGSVRLPLVA